MTLWNSKWSAIDSTVISGGFLFRVLKVCKVFKKAGLFRYQTR